MPSGHAKPRSQGGEHAHFTISRGPDRGPQRIGGNDNEVVVGVEPLQIGLDTHDGAAELHVVIGLCATGEALGPVERSLRRRRAIGDLRAEAARAGVRSCEANGVAVGPGAAAIDPEIKPRPGKADAAAGCPLKPPGMPSAQERSANAVARRAETRRHLLGLERRFMAASFLWRSMCGWWHVG